MPLFNKVTEIPKSSPKISGQVPNKASILFYPLYQIFTRFNSEIAPWFTWDFSIQTYLSFCPFCSIYGSQKVADTILLQWKVTLWWSNETRRAVWGRGLLAKEPCIRSPERGCGAASLMHVLCVVCTHADKLLSCRKSNDTFLHRKVGHDFSNDPIRPIPSYHSDR